MFSSKSVVTPTVETLMKRLMLPLAALLSLILLLGLAACSDDPAAPAAGAGEGRLVLRLTDAPGDYDAVNLSVVGVRVHRAGADTVGGDEQDGMNGDGHGGWMTVSEDSFTVDLLTLSGGHSLVLADTMLPAGTYTQVRLMLGEGCHVIVDGERHDLEVPSGEQSGLKLNHPFTLTDGVLHEATLDFDAHRSIHVTGNGRYMMKPVIRIVVTAVSGGLRGVVSPAEARAMVWAVQGTDSALAYADTLDGTFDFPLLRQGIYDVSFLPTAGDFRDTTVFDVDVSAGAVTELGTVALPPADQSAR
jgi:hypothetical protein